MKTDEISADDLSLRIAGGDMPFELLGPENNLGPDDWAWQFLRLRTSYQREYSNAKASHDPEDERPQGALTSPQKHTWRTIRVAERYCRKQFGLSTWLDPQLPRLPRLDHGESWFFPLRRSPDSPEDDTRRAVRECVFAYQELPYIGGYDRRLAAKAGVKVNAFSRSDVWFAVDCSVPPTAQLVSVGLVAKMHRNHLRQMKAEIHPRTGNEPDCVELAKCRWFDIAGFDAASAAAEHADSSSLWWAIRVDVLGPIKEQLGRHQRTLTDAYRNFCDIGCATPPIRERFRHELTGPRDDDGKYLSDGSFLKGMVICAQLAQRGLDENDIVGFVKANAAASVKGRAAIGSARDTWELTFSDRVVKYREEARAFVRGGYRWLVHAEKP